MTDLVSISTSDIIAIIENLKRPDWKTVRGIEYNKTLDTVLEEIKKLESEHNEFARGYALAKKTIGYPLTS